MLLNASEIRFTRKIRACKIINTDQAYTSGSAAPPLCQDTTGTCDRDSARVKYVKSLAYTCKNAFQKLIRSFSYREIRSKSPLTANLQP